VIAAERATPGLIALPRSAAGDALVLGVVFLVLALVAIHMASGAEAITNVWFANAAAIAFLATTERARWPLLLLAVALANLAANWALRGNFLLSASFVPGNLVEVTLGGWLLQRFKLARGFDASAGRFARTLIAGGLLPQLAGASIGAATLQGYGFATFQGAWLGWYVDSTLGALAVLPLALAMRNAQQDRTPLRLFTPASMLFLVVTVAIVFGAFWTMPTPFVMLTLPLVASVFFVAREATFGLCFVLVLVICAGLDYGWIQGQRGAAPWNNLLLYLPAAASVLPAQFMALVVSRMRRLQADTAALTLIGTDTIAVLDRQGMFRGVNRAFERVFGHERKALIGRPIEYSVEPAEAIQARMHFEQACRGEAVQVRAERKTAIGPRVLDLQYEPVPSADGRITRVLLSAHDVTDIVDVQRQLERTVERLRNANEGLQQFVRIASHDLREPLNTIAQFCSLVQADHSHELSATGRLYFEHIGGGATRMRGLLDDVLSFARLESGTAVSVRSVALSNVLDTVVAALGARIAGRQAHVEWAAPLPTVLGNESLLVLLFQNLVSNGIKFVPAEKTPLVRVSSRDDGEHVVITVADNGIGIAADQQAELFKPFKRLHTRRQYDGTGLGLAICKRIVEALGGTIALESQIGAGTQLHVRLRRPSPT
jgi:PAS domain S-box-containing protein